MKWMAVAAVVGTLAAGTWRIVSHIEMERSSAMLRSGEAQQALDGYERLGTWRADRFTVTLNAAAALLRLKRYDEAASRYRMAAAFGSEREQLGAAFFGLGNAHALAGRYAEAVEAYRESLRSTPDDDDAKFNLAWVMARLAQAARQPVPQPIPDLDLDALDRLRTPLRLNTSRPPTRRPPADGR